MSQNIQDTAAPSVKTQKSQDTTTEQEVRQESEVDGLYTQLKEIQVNEGRPITDIKVSLNTAEEESLRKKGFSQIKVDLNKGAGGDYIYIWYRKGSCGSSPITRVQFSFKDEMCKGLEKAGYTKVEGNLNAGAEGNFIYLWYYQGKTQYDVPIVDLKITISPDEEIQMFRSSYERLACDLNRRAGGNCILMWLKREKPTYICDITATSGFDEDVCHFKGGYIRMDEDTNRGTRGPYIFIWYRLTTDREGGINDMQVSINDNDVKFLGDAGYHRVDQDLNQDSQGPPVYLWYRKDEPIQNFCLVVKEVYMGRYKGVVDVIMKNLNKGNEGSTEYLCYRRSALMKNVAHALKSANKDEMSGAGDGGKEKILCTIVN